MPTVYRSLARYPEYFGPAWAAVRSTIASVDAERAAEALHRTCAAGVRAIAPSPVAVTLRAGARAEIRDVLEAFVYVNPKNLLLVTALREGWYGGGRCGDPTVGDPVAIRAGIPPDTPPIPLVAQDPDDPRVRAIFDEAGRIMKGAAVPSIYRALARWPAYLEAVWPTLVDEDRAAGIARAAGRLVDESVTACGRFALPVTLSRAAVKLPAESLDAIARTLDTFQHGIARALADGIAAAFGAYAVMFAVYHRDHHGGEGQEIDLALYDGLMRFLEPMLLEYDQLGTVRGRTGNRIADSSPRNAYRTSDRRWVAMSGSAQSIAERIMKAVEREDLLADPRFKDNPSRVAHAEELDRVIADWIGRHTLAEVLKRFEACEAALGPVYDAAQIFADPHFRARESLVQVPDPILGALTVMNAVPRLAATPAEIDWLGPEPGQHNEDVYCGRLGLAKDELAGLRARGVV